MPGHQSVARHKLLRSTWHEVNSAREQAGQEPLEWRAFKERMRHFAVDLTPAPKRRPTWTPTPPPPPVYPKWAQPRHKRLRSQVESEPETQPEPFEPPGQPGPSQRQAEVQPDPPAPKEGPLLESQPGPSEAEAQPDQPAPKEGPELECQWLSVAELAPKEELESTSPADSYAPDIRPSPTRSPFQRPGTPPSPAAHAQQQDDARASPTTSWSDYSPTRSPSPSPSPSPTMPAGASLAAAASQAPLPIEKSRPFAEELRDAMRRARQARRLAFTQGILFAAVCEQRASDAGIFQPKALTPNS